MLQLLRSMARQSNPSTLTTGLLPTFALAHPPFLEALGEAAEPGDGEPIGEALLLQTRQSTCSLLVSLFVAEVSTVGHSSSSFSSLPLHQLRKNRDNLHIFHEHRPTYHETGKKPRMRSPPCGFNKSNPRKTQPFLQEIYDQASSISSKGSVTQNNEQTA
ncbi:hypothetical protein Drorol1_Dr00008632 [Drosera rotundifolia]